MDDYWYDHRQCPDRFLCTGRWCKCEGCGKTFYVTSTADWVYKLQYQKMGKKTETLFFHTWSCYHKHQLQHENDLKSIRKTAADKGAAVRKARIAERIKGKKCKDCRYCAPDRFGFYNCMKREYTVRLEKNACSRFKEKDGE